MLISHHVFPALLSPILWGANMSSPTFEHQTATSSSSLGQVLWASETSKDSSCRTLGVSKISLRNQNNIQEKGNVGWEETYFCTHPLKTTHLWSESPPNKNGFLWPAATLGAYYLFNFPSLNLLCLQYLHDFHCKEKSSSKSIVHSNFSTWSWRS